VGVKEGRKRLIVKENRREETGGGRKRKVNGSKQNTPFQHH
jgi:hypothetical protein